MKIPSPHEKLAAWMENKEHSHKAMVTSLETYIEQENRMGDHHHQQHIMAESDDDDDLPSMQESLCSNSESEHTSIFHCVSEHLEEEEDDDDEIYVSITDSRESKDDSCNDTTRAIHSDDATTDDLNYYFSKLKSIANSKHNMFECDDAMSHFSSMYPDAATIFSSSTATSLSSSKLKKMEITKSNSMNQKTRQQQRRETDINPLFTSSSSSSSPPFSDPSTTATASKHQQRRKIERIKKNFPLPTKCEHCGCSKLCSPDCKRPKSFLQRQRPPFVPKGSPKWNLQTDYENQKVPIEKLSSHPPSKKPTPVVLREWDHTRSSTIQIQQERKQEESSGSAGIAWMTSWWN